MDDRKKHLTFCSNDCNDSTKKLHDTCKWDQLDNIAIEYHDLQEIVYIHYRELYVTKTMISDCLKCIKNTEFIGINFDVPEYCVISLILGILDSGHSFVNIPPDVQKSIDLKYRLNMNHCFCKSTKNEEDVIQRLSVHDECIYFVKLKNVQKCSTKQTNYAYAISTSGSIDTPKVVRVLHSCIIPNILDLNKILGITKDDKIAQFTNFTFDPSLIEIFLALSNAATLFMVSKSLKNNPNMLLEKAYSNQITILQTTPSVLMFNWTTNCLKASIFSSNTSLRVILLGGEPFPKFELVSEILKPCNNTKIYNIYGITEVSCWASINEIVLTNRELPHYLGQVLSHTVFQVRNEREEIITSGTGSLYIGSNQRVCVINDENIEELELPLFRDSGDLVHINEVGRIYYKGRKNSVIKRFGNKVDLTKLEEFVLQIDFVKSCYVLWDDDCHHLHLCFLIKDNFTYHENINNDIKKHLHKLDPLYRPDKIHFLEHVEFTCNGKVSLEFLRKRIKENTVDNIDLEKIETIFKSVWENNLQRGDGGFVKLGGTSIIALQISNTISEVTKTEFPELIGILLRDETVDKSLSYIKSIILNASKKGVINFKHDLNDIEKQPFVTTIVIEDSEVSKEDCDSLISINETHNCQWYKCRGQVTGNISNVSEHKLQHNGISKIKVLKKYDTKKCVDASPTIFHYSDKTYATVGSHSGFIFTFGLEKNCNSIFKIKLPDRIEASVLVLDDFKGIVGCYNGNVYCVSLKTGEIFWTYRTRSTVKCSAILCKEKEIVFVGSYDCNIYCLSTKDGSKVWEFKLGRGGISASGCLHFSSDTVLFGALDGSCLALQQSSGKLVWKHKLSDPIFVAPLLLNNGLVLFCSVTGLLCCFDIEVNIKMWVYKINGNVFSYLVKQNDIATNHENIILASQNKNVYCLHSEATNFRTEPTLKYVLNFHSPIFATPWCENNFLLVACTDGTLYIYNTIKNRLIKIEKLPGEVFSSPVVDNDVVIIGCRDDNIYVLQLD